MPVRRRTDKRRDALDEDEIAWLEGRISWFDFASLDEKREAWEKHGDKTNYKWHEELSQPIKKEHR